MYFLELLGTADWGIMGEGKLLIDIPNISRTAYCNVTTNYLSWQIRKITKHIRREDTIVLAFA